MKKKSLFVATIFSIVLLLNSCATVGARFGAKVTKLVEKVKYKSTEFTDKDAEYALAITLTRAINSANSRYYQKMGTFNFVPESYSELLQNKDSIPGMEKLIEKWNSEVMHTLTNSREELEKTVLKAAQFLNYPEPKELVAKSNTSASQLLYKTESKTLSDFFDKAFSNLDTTILETAVKQYNAWVTTENYKNGTNLEKITYTDCKEDVAQLSLNYYKDTLTTLEELYRTTPDPYTDEVCQVVFGIK